MNFNIHNRDKNTVLQLHVTQSDKEKVKIGLIHKHKIHSLESIPL